MINYEVRKLRSFRMFCGLAVLLAATSLTHAQLSSPQDNPGRGSTTRAVPSGAKVKFQGVVIERNADTFTIRDRTRTDYQVLITDDTSIKTHGGFLRSGKNI